LDDEEFLMSLGASVGQMLLKKAKLHYQKELERFTSEWKPMSEKQ
jgi:hypothetical protein